jgi:hypothetical protein
MTLYKAPFPPWTDIWEAYALPFALDPFVGKVLLASWWSLDVAYVMPILRLCQSCWGPSHFRRNSRWRNLVFIARLWLSSVESPAGYWHSRPFGWSRSSQPSAVEIPGTPAGR